MDFPDFKSVVEKLAYYCQKCRAANDPGEVNCRKCGTRLMLVVFPPSVRHEEGIMPSYYEDHLLERVSLLELRLAQTMEQLAMAYEFIQREVRSFQKDHIMLQSFFETLEKINPDLSELLSRECIELYGEKKEHLKNENRQEAELQKILAQHDRRQTELFTHLIRESLRLFQENEEKQAFRTLDRAILLSPNNVPLRVFAARQQFTADKPEKARENLEKAFELAPQNPTVLLLLGAIYADLGETEPARKLLSVLANNPLAAVCVNFIWGMLAAFEANWTESLAAFKESLNQQSSPELNYLIGCVYFQLKRWKSARKYLKRAVADDLRFADAWFMQSLVYDRLNEKDKAEQSRQAAFESREAGAQCLEFIKDKTGAQPEKALPFLHFDKENKRLLTNGSLRLNKFIREKLALAID